MNRRAFIRSATGALLIPAFPSIVRAITPQQRAAILSARPPVASRPPTINTKTIKSSGGDYTSLSNWEAGRDDYGDLVALNTIEVAECYSMLDTTAFTIGGWTTSAINYIKITTPTSERHNGKWDSTKYRLETTTSNDLIVVTEDFVILEGLQLSYNGNGQYTDGIVFSSLSPGASVRVSECIIKATLTGANHSSQGITFAYHASGARTFVCRNNVVYGFIAPSGASVGIAVGSSLAWPDSFVDNCTVYGCTVGFGSTKSRNCVAQSCTDGFSNPVNGGTNNCSNIASDAPGSNPQTGTVQFIDSANEDFHLSAGDTVARDNGTDLSATFTTDIDGQTRIGSWDIGADEYQA